MGMHPYGDLLKHTVSANRTHHVDDLHYTIKCILSHLSLLSLSLYDKKGLLQTQQYN